MKTNSFTLIELLVVIAIIGILAGIIILSLGDNTDLAREAKAKAELSQITKTLLIYKTGNSVYPIDDCDLSEAGSCTTLRSAIPNLPITEESITYESDGLVFTTRATLTTAEYETTSSNPQVLQVGGGAPATPTAEAAVSSPNPDDGDTVNLSSTLAAGTATAWSWDCGVGVIATTANTSFDTTGLGGTMVTCTVTINDTYTDSVNINVLEVQLGSYSSLITINNLNATLTDYQVDFTLDYSFGMQSDFDDIRFATDSAGLNEIPYWIEEKTDGVSAKVWVKVPSIVSSIQPDLTDTAGGTAFGDSQINAFYLYSMAFDNDSCSVGENSNYWQSENSVMPHFVGWDFGIGNEQIVNKYTLRPFDVSTNAYNSKSWKFQGSNNYSDWIDLDTQIDQTSWTICANNEYSISNNVAYRYYRIYVTSNNGANNYALIQEMELYNSINTNIYAFYGNASAVSASNGDDVFDFFDDFSSASLDTSKWSIVSGATITQSDGICDIYASSASGVIMGIKSLDSYGIDTAIRTKYRAGPSYSLFGYTNIGSGGWNGAYNMWRYNLNIPTLYSYSSTTTGESDPGTVEYHVWDLMRNGSTSLISKRDDNETMVVNTANTDLGKITFSPYTIGHIYADWVAVRKYADIKPSISF